MRIGIIGTGTIAAAVVEGLAGDGHRITVSERSRTRSQDLAERFDEVSVAGNQAVLDASDVVFLGLMASAAPDILAPLRFREGQRVVSLMADATLADVARLVAPAEAAAVMIPFPAISRGGSPILALGDTTLIEVLFGARNTVLPLAAENEFAAYMVAQSLLSAAALMVSRTAQWLAPRVAEPAEAEAFLRRLIASALDGQDSDTLLAQLDTPGGYNQRMRVAMEEADVPNALHATFDRLSRNP
ncbi:pyrroline-5-carboxylate reductase [Palleronia marisminoris]|uniref:Pyrroline-5-carboxylate reductase n=1 Tax=Palleronia marisminoris TaxID=315423 RepID=A0A1Y5TCS3_9RHOB|nr:NAD(P)-binding domain-containing protein [Palleronia marisminoris]SFH21783.1 pyrroline-5-carboxylate reductase [Palleronia marisminoris]SLN57466.1 pyrroline-5-carboxylate reductase [Palleronia marisminoris]